MTDNKTPGDGTTAGEELVEITIDGKTVLAPKGKNLLEALVDAGEPISFFCYHPGLSVAAQCRQCLVGLGDGHRLVPSCQCKVEPGMKVRSRTEQVLGARQAILEYTLLNHPIDCVICDKAGECALQRHYMDWDAQPARINHDKVHKPKKVDLGPHIVLDAERCILCSRCVRFCAEIAGEPQLLLAERGDHTELTTAPGQRLDNPYSLNTVDICPVGALTDKDFRFRKRVWELFSTRSVCNGCAAGCTVEIHHCKNEVYRLVPPKRWDVNLGWMCDYGRRTYKQLRIDRVTQPQLQGAPSTMEAALDHMANVLSTIAAGGSDGIAVVLGADASNEDNFAAAELARDVLGARLFYTDLPDDGHGDKVLRRDDPNPNRTGAVHVAIGIAGHAAGAAELAAELRAGSIRALYVIGDTLDLPSDTQPLLSKLMLLAVQATHISELTKAAHVVLPASAWAEIDGTLTTWQHEIKRMRSAVEPPGEARPHWSLISGLRHKLGHVVRYDVARDVFEAMRDKVPFFRRASWGEEYPTVPLRWGGRRG